MAYKESNSNNYVYKKTRAVQFYCQLSMSSPFMYMLHNPIFIVSLMVFAMLFNKGFLVNKFCLLLKF